MRTFWQHWERWTEHERTKKEEKKRSWTKTPDFPAVSFEQGIIKGEGAFTSSRPAQLFLTACSPKLEIPNRQVMALAAYTRCNHIRKHRAVLLTILRRSECQIDIVRILWCEFYLHLSIINPKIFSYCACARMRSSRNFYPSKRICTIPLWSCFKMISFVQQIWCRCALEMEIFWPSPFSAFQVDSDHRFSSLADS